MTNLDMTHSYNRRNHKTHHEANPLQSLKQIPFTHPDNSKHMPHKCEKPAAQKKWVPNICLYKKQICHFDESKFLFFSF